MGIGVIAIPILVESRSHSHLYLIFVPFPWDYHGTPIPIGIPNPMHISTPHLKHVNVATLPCECLCSKIAMIDPELSEANSHVRLIQNSCSKLFTQ